MSNGKDEEDHEMAPLTSGGETEALLRVEGESTGQTNSDSPLEPSSPKEIRGWLCASFAVEVFAIVSLTLFLRK